MSMKAGWARVSMVLGVALLSGVASGQVAPPPGSAPEPVRDYTPPPMPAQAVAPAPRPASRPAARPQPLPDIAYESLVKRDGEGALVHLDEPPTLAALRVNPLIDADLRPAVEDVLEGRRALFRELVMQYIDDALEVDAGKLSRLRVGNRDELQDILGTVERLSTRTAESELEDLGVITPEAAAFTRKIATEYLQALQNELLDDYDPEGDTTLTPQDVIVQMMFGAHLGEAKDAYEEIAQAMPAFVASGGLETLDLSDEQRAAIGDRPSRLGAMGTGEGEGAKTRRKLSGEIIRELTPDQREALLEGLFRKAREGDTE